MTNALDFTGKVALVTGAAAGMGLATAQAFAAAGAAGWIVGHARVTRELLGALPRLEVISRRGVGYVLEPRDETERE